MQEQTKYMDRVEWNEQKERYEVQAIHPSVFSWCSRSPPSTFKGDVGIYCSEGKAGSLRRLLDRLPAIQGTLKKKYIGTPAAVTIARLEEIADDLQRLTIPEANT